MSYLRLTKIKVLGVFLIFVALGGIFLYYWNQENIDVASTTNKNPLVVAFEASGGEFQKLTVQSWGKVNSSGDSIEEIHAIFGKIQKIIGEDVELVIEESTDDYYVGITVTGKTKEGYDLNLTLQSISDTYEDDETYLIVNLQENLDYREAAKIAATAQSYFAAVKTKAETSTLITGYFDKIINAQAKTALGTSVFAAVGGEVIEGVDSGTYLSKSGYCPGIEESITSNGKKINLQIAIFDNEVQKQTGLYIGSPLIFSEY